MNGEAWTGNYFNYFTEVEEHFQRARGSSLFLMSPLDWALVESWKNAGVPLEAVLRGIDDAFEKYHASKRKNRQMVNSLSYCAQAVSKAAEEMLNNRPARRAVSAEESLPMDLIRESLASRIPVYAAAGFDSQSRALREILDNLETEHADLESMEHRLTAIEEKVMAQARANMPESELAEMRKELEMELRPHRARLSAAELSMLEKSFLDRALFNKLGLPRLSLYFLL
jgi:hypothetical protein